MAWFSLSARRRAARLEKTLAGSGSRMRGIARSAKDSIWAGSRTRCTGHDLAKPGPMMLPGPPRCHPASSHRLDRSLHPDCRVDVDDDRADEHKRTHGVHDGCQTYDGDREIEGK